MGEKNNKPKIRFKGFEEKWEEKELGELVQLKDSARIPNELWAESGVRYLRSSDLENSGQDGKLFISIDAYEDYKSKTGAPELGDVLFNSGGNIGLSLLKTDNTPLYVQGGAILYARTSKSKDVDGGYLSVYFSTPRMVKYIDISSAGGTIKHFTLKPANAAPFIFPNVIEQREVSAFFKHLDHLITLHQQKYNKLTTIKKSMLEKMFPQNGAVVPEIRFKGFTEPWEVRELNTWADRYDNLRVPITATDRILGSTPYYGANGIQGYVEGYTHDGEFILVAEDGANDLKNYPVQYVNGTIWVNNHAHVLQAKKNIADNKFLKYTISQTNIEPYLVGGGRAKLNAETMMKIEISAPKNIQEQEIIGAFFKNLDHLITLQQRELEKLKNIKKACLEKMFV